MAPEQYLGGQIDQRCDVYSAGVLLFELLTGRKPFSGALTEIIYQACHVMPSAASSLEPSIPARLDPLLAKALAKNPDARFQTAGEFAAALREVSEALGLALDDGPQNAVAAADVDVAPTEPAVTLSASRSAPTEPLSTPAMPAAGAPPGWSSAELGEVERHLTPILGPMARIVVRRAAALTRDRERLCTEIAAQLRTDEERGRFLGAVSTASRKNELAVSASPARPPAATSSAEGAIAAATLDRTAKILTRYIGPIASVLVKKTASAALDESDLYARLAQRITDSHERARFMAELTQPF